jgi:hypothetical protein
MGHNLVILASHKIHFTLKKKPILAIPSSHKILFTLEKGTHPCNTCISNRTYIGKKDPSMQYLHIKCNLHWKREPINAIPT